MTDAAVSTLTDWELAQITRANESGLTPITFVHGLWLLSSSWQNWRDFFEANGYTTITPGWPDDPATLQDAYQNPEVFAHKMVQGVTDHCLEAISLLTKKTAVIGHSFGGLISLKIAGEGASFATVSIDNAPFNGILPLPLSALKSAAPVLANPANRGRAVSLTFEQFQFGWTNNLDETEARHLYETYHVPASGAPLFQAAFANFNPFGGETKVNTENPDRGPVLVIAGGNDNTVPTAITHATHKYLAKHSDAVTEVIDVPDRGHSLVIDHGWRDVAEIALSFIKRFS
jgi:non-heme chloroperoxidase